MKDQYFGDVNDYLKYGILRGLAGEDLRLFVAWMLTPGDGRSDGRFIEYLERPGDWRGFDPPLFDFIRSSVVGGGRREVSAIEHWSGLDATFLATQVPDQRAERDRWTTELIGAIPGHDLVFFDPDNGIEIPSKPKGRKDSSKFVQWEELRAGWAMGASLLVYQHFGRKQRDILLAEISGEFHARLGASEVMVLRTPRVAFFLVPQEGWVDTLRRRAESVAERWYPHVRLETA